ncbi:MAG: hypothetical protein IKS47_02005 [Bacteroidales bacterium]|nr:hypothetical protein [Bacteroidales bacterium]
MKTNTRKQYEAPKVQVVEMQVHGVICQSGGGEGIMWILNDPNYFGSDAEFGRDGYGSATTF